MGKREGEERTGEFAEGGLGLRGVSGGGGEGEDGMRVSDPGEHVDLRELLDSGGLRAFLGRRGGGLIVGRVFGLDVFG